MRQAGRYLPEYRAVRAEVSFLELCKSPDLAAEVTLQPIDRLGVDAAILFSDILIPLEAMGVPLEFTEEGPKLEPVRDEPTIDALFVPDPMLTCAFVADGIREVLRRLDGRVPLLGFAGAPFTLLTYAVEGGGSKDFVKTKSLLYSAPQAARELLELLQQTVADYLLMQIEAGVHAVQLFDTWASVLSPQDYDQWAGPWLRGVIERVRDRAPQTPIIVYVNGVAPLLERIAAMKPDVMSIDWRIDLAEARRRVGGDIVLQGNLDPVTLYGPVAELERQVAHVLAAAAGGPHIFNLGHGILPTTPVDHTVALVELVHRLSRATR
jgi:uroporphyrinogen decarboxylase